MKRPVSIHCMVLDIRETGLAAKAVLAAWY
jgi:hypothetical protein